MNRSAGVHHTLAWLARTLLALLALIVPVWIVLCDPAVGKARCWAWASCVTGLAGLLALEGLVVRGRLLGLWIDERNRYSLSRLQISLWTVLVNTTLYVVFMSNIVHANDLGQALEVRIDPNLIALMGISVVSFIASPMALSLKTAQQTNSASVELASAQLSKLQSLDAPPRSRGRLLVKASPDDARLGDLIRSEDIASATSVDLPRTQLLIITGVVFLSYGALVARLMVGSVSQIDGLPALSQTLLLLILVSHGGYIGGKLAPSSTAPMADPQLGARAQQVNQRASDIASDLQIQLAKSTSTDPASPVLQSALALARATSADAAQLTQTSGPTGPQPSDVAKLEGRLDALQASTSTLVKSTNGSSCAGLDAPAPDTVNVVQRKLLVQGYPVTPSGIVNVATARAVGQELARLGIKREQLHPRGFRFYEELVRLVGGTV